MKPPEKPADPPMTPMIDVIFQLLIFFVLTVQFKTVEGKLLSRLPKEGRDPGTEPLLPEIRITVCCDDLGDSGHPPDRRAHARALEEAARSDLARTDGCPAHRIVNDVCAAAVERMPAVRLYRTAVCALHRESDLPLDRRSAENARAYRDLADRVGELRRVDPRASVILEADADVPYEHLIGIANALKAAGIQNLQFAAAPR